MENILIIPGSYKSTISASVAGDIIRQEYLHHRPFDNIRQVTITDGGEGTLETFSRNFGGVIRYYSVRGMSGNQIVAKTLWINEFTAVIESASVVGYSLVSEKNRNPWNLSSYGIGELILNVKFDGAKTIYITMGDSAIMDIGVGMLSALGVRIFDADNHSIEPSTLSCLSKICAFDCEKMVDLSDVNLYALVDTKDYLCGKYGQTKVYGKQKGLAENQAMLVEEGFCNYSKIIQDMFSIDFTSTPMATGSGGLAASLNAFCAAPLIHCPEFISEKIGLQQKIASSSIIITGEGLLDNQTKWGKIPYFVSQNYNGDIFLIVGGYTEEGLNDIKSACKGNVHVILLDNSLSPHLGIAAATKEICSIISKNLKDG